VGRFIPQLYEKSSPVNEITMAFLEKNPHPRAYLTKERKRIIVVYENLFAV
jgi:hypothetical protein